MTNNNYENLTSKKMIIISVRKTECFRVKDVDTISLEKPHNILIENNNRANFVVLSRRTLVIQFNASRVDFLFN